MATALRLLGTEFAKGLDTPLPGRKIKDHIANGAIEEDMPIDRVIFHFHDPNKVWDEAGLSVIPPWFPSVAIRSESSILWQHNKDQGGVIIFGGDGHSWFDARNSYLADLR